MRNPYALALAQTAVSASNITQVAAAIGYHRTSLSRYLNEEDYPSPAPLEAALLELLDRRSCPHTGLEISADQCRRKATAPRPFGGATRARHWSACQSCMEGAVFMTANAKVSGEPRSGESA